MPFSRPTEDRPGSSEGDARRFVLRDVFQWGAEQQLGSGQEFDIPFQPGGAARGLKCIQGEATLLFPAVKPGPHFIVDCKEDATSVSVPLESKIVEIKTPVVGKSERRVVQTLGDQYQFIIEATRLTSTSVRITLTRSATISPKNFPFIIPSVQGAKVVAGENGFKFSLQTRNSQ